ncbi:VanZ family protein [Terriglobus roseus]|uniref:VanZ like family protein n=1 Tax=Terriglobus roseus TaxID=392734 RepID=A0A1G7FA32_9BACT|nr:VanZ family protein [Terriglobus roseus]SDE72355.1 VanZ like family protein [Terriglobus roseus]
MAISATAPASVRHQQAAWLPVLCGIAVICGESTNTMGAVHTSIWLSELAAWAGHPNGAIWLINHILRKSGHFTGYGLLGVFFARGWYSVLRRRIVASWSTLRMRAAMFGILSAAVVASADEIHQIFLPTRGASVWDVLLDTSGAVVLNGIFLAFLAARRNALLHPQTQFITLGLSFAQLPEQFANSHDVRALRAQSAKSIAEIRRGVRNTKRWSAPSLRTPTFTRSQSSATSLTETTEG